MCIDDVTTTTDNPLDCHMARHRIRLVYWTILLVREPATPYHIIINKTYIDQIIFRSILWHVYEIIALLGVESFDESLLRLSFLQYKLENLKKRPYFNNKIKLFSSLIIKNTWARHKWFAKAYFSRMQNSLYYNLTLSTFVLN